MQGKNISEENKKPKDDQSSADKNEHVREAFEEAEHDIELDPDLKPDADADLDEGELARKEGHP